MKKINFIIIIVINFILLITIFITFRIRGIEQCHGECSNGRYGLCRLLAKIFPAREVVYYKNGNIRKISIIDNIKPCCTVNQGYYANSRLIRGYYYSPSGQLISKIENGNGIGINFTEKGEILSIWVVRNNIICKDIFFRKDNDICIDSINSSGKAVRQVYLIRGQ